MDISLTNVQTSANLPDPNAPQAGGDILNKDSFFKLMITQLQYQDPLDPMNNDQFINQLAQLTQVEELQKANENLTDMLMGLSAINNATMVNLVGQEVKALHDGIYYPGEGSKTIHYDLQTPATTVSVAIYDEEDRLISTKTFGPTDEGLNEYTWDGRTNDGRTAEEGQYKVRVTAVDADGNPVTANPLLIGTIEELDYSTGQAVPIVDDQVLSISQIISLVTPDDAADGSTP